MSRGATHSAITAILAAMALGGCSLLLDFSEGDPPTYPAAECAFGEPNDLLETAIPLPAAPVAAALCRPDIDFYAFAVAAGQNDLRISLRFTQKERQGDLDLYLYDPAGKELGFARSVDNDELLACPSTTCGSLPPGDYVFEVRESISSTIGNRYRLELTAQ